MKWKKYIEITLVIFIFFLGFFLRVYKISTAPPGLNQDEISIGYNATKILHTGKDEYGIPFPIFFRSLDDYKLGGYIYLTSLSIASFGENDFAIRFPSALFGSMTILILYFFTKELFREPNNHKRDLKRKEHTSLLMMHDATHISLFSALLLAISPWHLQFSRVAFESATALCFFLAGCWMLLLFARRKQMIYVLLGFLLLLLASYIYHTYQVLSPLIVIVGGFLLLWKEKKWKKIFLGVIFCIALGIPLFTATFFGGGLARSSQVSAFVVFEKKPFVTKLVMYPEIYIKNYFSYYSFSFLFVSGDEDGQHQVSGVAPIPAWEFPFLLLGIYTILQEKNKKTTYILLGLLLITPLIPAVATPSPHTLRALPMVIPLTILIAFGIVFTLNKFHKKQWMLLLIVGCMCLYELSTYLYKYYIVYPVSNLTDWGFATKQIVLQAARDEETYRIQKIVIDENMGLVSVAFPFYTNDKIVKPPYVSSNWQKPEKTRNVLYIKPFSESDKNTIDVVYLDQKQTKPFAEFLKF